MVRLFLSWSLHRTTDLSRAEERHRKSQEACSTTLARAKDAEKRLRAETGQNERISAELAKMSEVKALLIDATLCSLRRPASGEYIQVGAMPRSLTERVDKPSNIEQKKVRCENFVRIPTSAVRLQASAQPLVYRGRDMTHFPACIVLPLPSSARRSRRRPKKGRRKGRRFPPKSSVLRRARKCTATVVTS